MRYLDHPPPRAGIGDDGMNYHQVGIDPMTAATAAAGAVDAVSTLAQGITIRRAPFSVRQARKRIRKAYRKQRRGRGRGPKRKDLKIVEDYEKQVMQERLLAAQAQTQPSGPAMQQQGPSVPGGAPASPYGYGAPSSGGFDWQAAMQLASSASQFFPQQQAPSQVYTDPATGQYVNPYFNPAAYGAWSAQSISGHGISGHGMHDDFFDEVLDDAASTQIGDNWRDGYGEGQRERYQPIPSHLLAPLPEERQERIIALEKRIARLLENAPTPPHQRLLRKLIARHNVIRQRLGA